MKNIILVVILLATLFINPDPIWADNDAVSSASLFMANPDTRIVQLKKFFTFYKSPLVPYAGDFIAIADKYELDWKLIPAISGVESTFGKAIPYNSYNAYGWANGGYNFDSWEDSIEIVAKTLKEKYINRGANTVDKIAPIYAPPSTTWAGKVKYFMAKLENFGMSSPLTLELSL